jgi:MFS family permease
MWPMTGIDEASWTRPLRPYAEIFKVPGAWRFSAAGVIGRMPMSMFGLGTVLLISSVTGKYGEAGAVSAIGSLGYAFVGPSVARLADAHGQHRVLLPLVLVFALSTAGLILAVELRAPTWAFFLPGAVSGSTTPSLGTMVRARWSTLLTGTSRLHAAFSFESVADELCFIIGPGAVTLLATDVHPASGVGVAVVLALTGTLWLAAQRGTEPSASARAPVTVSRRPGAARRSGMAAPGLVVLVPIYLFLGMTFVSIDLSTVAFAQHFGHKALSGFILGVYAFGSASGGLWYGSRHWRTATQARFVLTLCLTVIGVATFWAMPNLIALTCVIYLCGMSIAPTLIAGFSLLEEQALPSRRTEAMSLLSSGISVGVAAGASVVGFILDAHGARYGYVFAASCGAVSAATAVLGRRRLTYQPPRLSAIGLGVLGGELENLAHVPGGVVVIEDRLGQAGRAVGGAVGAQHARGGGDRVECVHDVRRAGLAKGVDAPDRPGGRQELHRSERACARRADVHAVAALDLADGGQDRPGQSRAVGGGRVLVQRQVVRRHLTGLHGDRRDRQIVRDHDGHQVDYLAACADHGPDLVHQRSQISTRRVDQHGHVLDEAELRGPLRVDHRVDAGDA